MGNTLGKLQTRVNELEKRLNINSSLPSSKDSIYK